MGRTRLVRDIVTDEKRQMWLLRVHLSCCWRHGHLLRYETRRLSMRYISSCYCLLLCEAIYGCRSEEFFCTAEVCGQIARVWWLSRQLQLMRWDHRILLILAIEKSLLSFRVLFFFG